jgi:hypothetical protein
MGTGRNGDDNAKKGEGGATVTPIGRPRTDRETPQFSRQYKGGVISGPDEASIQMVIESIEQSSAKRARWPKDGRQAMTALAKLLPSMRDVPGTDPWDAVQLVAWCNTGAPTSGSGWAARFLLSVWNPSTNWNEEGLPGAPRFDLLEAWAIFDDQHRAGVMQWLDAPFWP